MGFMTAIGRGLCGKCGAQDVEVYALHDRKGRAIERCGTCAETPSVYVVRLLDELDNVVAEFSSDAEITADEFPDGWTIQRDPADSLPCHVCGTLIARDELDENAAYTADGQPHCPAHYPKE